MREKNTFEELATLDALIRRVRQFHALNPTEQKQVLDDVSLWLSLDRQALASQEEGETQREEAALGQIMAWCQTDDYAYKEWK